MATSYAGDVTPSESWDILAKEAQAQIIDVRTSAEWNFVGVPDTRAVDKQVLLQQWQMYPDMQIDADFAGKLSAMLDGMSVPKDAPLLFLCRSGARSRSAAVAMTQAGYSRAYQYRAAEYFAALNQKLADLIPIRSFLACLLRF